jgi:hypothetical protein
MTEPKEENKEEQAKRATIWIVQSAPRPQTIKVHVNHQDKLDQILWNKKEIPVIHTSNTSERQKEVHKELVWDEAETELRNKILM